MRPITKTMLCAFVAAGVTAPALAASTGFFLKLEGVDGESTKAKGSDNHKEQIEILSWSWGASQMGSGGSGQGSGKVNFNDISVSRQAATGGMGAGKVSMQDMSVMRGPRQTTAADGVQVAAGDVNGDGRADTVTSPRDAASGQATGKRQHLPVRVRSSTDQGTAPAEKRQHGSVTILKALDRGAVRVKVKSPWVGCRVGARYAKLSLGGDQPYQLNDAIVTSCGSESGGGRGLEEVSFNYAKIQVRGWDPAKKQDIQD